MVAAMLRGEIPPWLVLIPCLAGVALLVGALRTDSERPRRQGLLLALGLAAILLPLTPRDTNFDSAIRQARAFLGGAVSLPERITWLEMFQFEGSFYFAYPPMVSAVVAPWVLLTGGHGGQPLFNTLLILASALLLHALMKQLDGLRRYAVIGPIAYAIGTPLLYSASNGNVWLLMHSEANVFLLLALWFGFARRAYGWAGVFLSIGAQCRHVVALASLTFLVRFLLAAPRGRRMQAVFAHGLRFGIPALLAALPTLLFSWLVFGDPLLSPYTLGWLEWGNGELQPNFSTEYLLPNLRFYFTATPGLLPEFPFVDFGPGGQSTWLMSPFLFGAWFAPWRLRFVRPFAAGAAAMGLFYLLYRYQGQVQLGARYVQDLFPLLVPLAVAGCARAGRAGDRLLAALVAVSIAIHAYAVYVILAFAP